MKKLNIVFSFFIFCYLIQLISSTQKFERTFGSEDDRYVAVNSADKYIVKAKFSTKEYLYIFPKFEPDSKGTFKIFFKKFKENDEDANTFNSEYYTLEVNSGLLIDASKLDYDVANIFIISYGSIKVNIYFQIVSNILFPKTTLINQFLLPKSQKVQIYFTYDYSYNVALQIISKYSLRNINVKIKNPNKKEITFANGGNIYPNGYSFLFEENNYDKGEYTVEIENKAINKRDEIIILGLIGFLGDNTFTNFFVNGYQLYLDRIYSELWDLKNGLDKPFYYTYQINAKKVEFKYEGSNGNNNGKNEIQEYNSMVCDSTNTYQMSFDFSKAGSSYIGIYIQFLDFNNLEIAQKNLQPLVSGLPKSILLPAGKSLYHFLPFLEDSKEIHYYIRSKVQNSNMFVTFKACENYPEDCSFNEPLSSTTSVPLIENIGMWYTAKVSNSSLQLIYVYCQSECSYDVLMSYDEDPLFMFPDNNYTKYLGGNKKDIFALPVFEYLSTYDELKIDLNVMSGNAQITIYQSLENLINNNPINNINSETIGTRKTYTIAKATFSQQSYYKKELYVQVKGDAGSFYNLMYTTINTGVRVLDNNRVFNDVIKADSTEVKTYTFENKGSDFYIAITTSTCKSKITINDDDQPEQDNHHLYKYTNKGNCVVKISLITDDDICKNGFEDEIMIYTYNSDNTDILIGENNFIWSSFIGSKINFKYFFNPISQNGDNSYNLELQRLSSKQISYEYKIERISFDKTQEENTKKLSLNQALVSKKNVIITSSQILSICDDLNDNEVCGLTLSFTPSNQNEKTLFSFYLNKNNKNNAHILTQETLVSSVNSEKSKYYYIELNKNYDTEIVINSYGNDLEVKYDISKEKTRSVIPFSNFENAKNYHQIHISKNDYSNCGIYCRLYIGVHMPKTNNEMSTTFSLNYFFVGDNQQKTDITLPLNYQSHYKFDNLDQITYTLQLYDKSNIVLELTSESPNIEFTASVTNSGNTKELKSGNKLLYTNVEGKMEISIPTAGKNSMYKIKSSSIGKVTNNPIYPMLSSFSEECSIENIDSACYYLVDKTPDMNNKHFIFFVPESEDIYISIQELDLGFAENPNSNINEYLSLTKEYTFTTKGKMQRPNWCDYSPDDNKSLLIRLASLTGKSIKTNLLTSFSYKPSTITLNYGEKRTFNIDSNDESELSINIPKASGSKNKYKINLHSIKGNFLFKIKDQSYNLGMQYNFKEDMSIIVDSDNIDKNLVLKASIIKPTSVSIDEFAFSVDYIVESKDKLIYEFENEKMNTFKFCKDTALSDIHLYMKANYTINNEGKLFKDINMNIKVYSSEAEFEVKSYIVNDEIVGKIKSGSINAPDGKTIGNIKTYINGGKKENGDLTLSKLEIESSAFVQYINEASEVYVYLILTQKKGSESKNVKINLYSYDMLNSNKALERNELIIQKLPPKTLDYQFLLVKMDIFYNEDIHVEYTPPNSKKYTFGAMHSENKDGELARSNNTIDPKISEEFGKKELTLKSRDVFLRYLLFDIYADQNNLENNEDLFLFKYRQANVGKDIFLEYKFGFNVTGYTNKLIFNYKSHFVRDEETGKSVIIIKGYQKSSTSSDSTALSLIFSDKKAIFSHYIIGNTGEKKLEVSVDLSEGEYTFAYLQIIEDNEREEYLGQELYNLKIESALKSNPFIDFIKNHILATVIIVVVILLFIALMVNICRNERKQNAGTEINIGEVSGEMIPK